MVAQPTDQSPRLALESVSVSFDRLSAVREVTMAVAPGEVVCLLGPSGCGKSTTLRVAAGVERQTTGRVLIDGATVSDDVVHQPPEGRGVGLMFQDFALFPHLSVADNVAFGLRRSMGSKARRALVVRELERVNLLDKAARYPHHLSGGEQQRVALARALAPKPKVMLMDEPFSGLDTRLRDEVREVTLGLLSEAGTAVMLVTHEPDEAMRMGDRIALMRDGRIVQAGAPPEVYNHPADREAAAFFSDINVLRAPVRHGAVETVLGRFGCPGAAEGSEVEIVFRPQHVVLSPQQGASFSHVEDGDLVAEGRVIKARFVGAQSLIDVAVGPGAQVLRAAIADTMPLLPGAAVTLQVRRAQCHIFTQKGALGEAAASRAA